MYLQGKAFRFHVHNGTTEYREGARPRRGKRERDRTHDGMAKEERKEREWGLLDSTAEGRVRSESQ